ncbi:MAG: copper amine oxidase N-terminal domain-containing protein [Anaerotignum sp.]|nr:copper amine oxidase N-terminal domain-containing protein [Anaerotignum sp.]
MKKTIKTMISALLISSLCAGTAFAAEFDPSLDVDTSKGGKIIVSINEENNAVLADKQPKLTIPCEFDAAYVEFNGEAIPSVLTDGEISFIVSAGGEYSIIEKETDHAEDNEQNDSGSNTHRPGRRPSSGKKNEAEKLNEEKDVAQEAEKDMAPLQEKTEIILTIGDRNMQIDGESVAYDAAPVIKGERTFLPIRFIAEALGASVFWNEGEQSVTITKEGLEIVIFIGQPFAMVNGEPVQLDEPAFIAHDRTYLPLRFVAENLGAEVIWNDADRTITVICGE